MAHPSFEYARHFNSSIFTAFDNGLFVKSISRFVSDEIPEFIEPEEVLAECATSAFEIVDPPPMIGYDPRCRYYY